MKKMNLSKSENVIFLNKKVDLHFDIFSLPEAQNVKRTELREKTKTFYFIIVIKYLTRILSLKKKDNQTDGKIRKLKTCFRYLKCYISKAGSWFFYDSVCEKIPRS